MSSGRPAPPPLPGIHLSLEEIAVFRCRDELLRRPRVIRVIGGVVPRHGDKRRMMEIIIPDCIHAKTVRRYRRGDDCLLVFAFRSENDLPLTCRCTRSFGNTGKNVSI